MTRKRKPDAGDNETPKAPRDLLPIESSWLEMAKRRIKVRKDGLEEEISIEQAIIQKQAETALKGSTHAQGQILRAMQKAERIAARKAEAEVERGLKIQANVLDAFKAWVTAGKDPKLCVPHPDDIVVTKGVGWKIIGPFDEESLKDTLKRCAERDAFFMQAILEGRLASREEWQAAGDDHAEQPGSLAYFMAYLIDGNLPLRFRLTTNDICQLDDISRSMTQRELLAHTYALWRSIGQRVPRGRRLPSLKTAMPTVNAIAATTKLMDARDRAGKPMTVEEIAKEMTDNYG